MNAKYLGQAVASLYPTANPAADYIVGIGESGQPEMLRWNADVLGPDPRTDAAAGAALAAEMVRLEALAAPPSPAVAARSRVNTWRLAREESGFVFMGKPFDSDRLSAQRIHGAVTAAQLREMQAPGSFSQEWRAKDNTMVPLNAMGMMGLFGALSTHIATTFAQAQAAKHAIDAPGATVADIEAALAALPAPPQI